MEFNGVPVDLETKLVRGDKGWDPRTGAISFPIYQSATFRHPSLEESTGYDYSRQNNPTREELENTLGALEGGAGACAFSTGMAALAAIFELFRPGDHLIVSEDLYGGTYRILQELLLPRGIRTSYVDARFPEQVFAAKEKSTKALLLETPSNPLMRVSDLRLLSAWAKAEGLLSIVDNTFLTPYLQRPLSLGADLVIHSGTKFLGGHNDLLAGFAVAKSPELLERLRFIQKTTGAVLAPFDSWLLLRGLKTLAVRMDRQELSAHKIAEVLKTLPQVSAVYYPGLAEHEGHELNKSQSKGFGSMVAFRVKEAAMVPHLLRTVKVVTFAESLGGVESLITWPMTQTHAAIPEEIRQRLGVDATLLRLSVGLEHVDDLIIDLSKALESFR